MLERSPLQNINVNPAERDIFGRRALFAVLFIGTFAACLALAVFALSPGGFSIIDIALLGLFAITLPWMVAGFWNAVIGLMIMRLSGNAVATIMPVAARI